MLFVMLYDSFHLSLKKVHQKFPPLQRWILTVFKPNDKGGDVDDDDTFEKYTSEWIILVDSGWLNIRGFSAAGSFVERFKQCQEKSTQKAVDSRKV